MQERTVTDLAVASGMTVAELHAIPDDGMRRELIDGELFVTPAPMPGHQAAAAKLHAALLPVIGERLMLFAPVDVFIDDRSCVQPDLVVYSEEQRGQLSADVAPPKGLAPEVAVEISSPSTRRIDLIHKRRLFERAGVREYWFVDRKAGIVDVYVFATDELRSASGEQHIPSDVLVPDVTVAALLAW